MLRNFVSVSSYIGCYEEIAEDPEFNVTLSQSDSVSSCVSACRQAGFLYAALQNGSQCYCGNSYGRHGSVHYDNCRVPCNNGNNEPCGGINYNAVYSTEQGL